MNRQVGPARRKVDRTPRVELLETRQCLTATAGLLADGTLLISGDNRADTIEVVDNGSATIGLNGNFRSFGVGAVGDPSGNYDVLFGGVTRISVVTRGGNDFVSYRTAGDVFNPQTLEMDLGSGNDRLDLTAGNIANANFSATIVLGSGNDRLNANLFGDLLNTYTFLDVDGGSGNDDIGLKAVDLFLANNSTLDALIDGGTGNDLVTGELSLNPTSSGLLEVSALGGRGNDRVALEVYQVANVADGSFGTLDGGPGRDTYFATPEIQVFNVEPVSKKRR